jgi:hypothetical protein
MLSNGKTDWIHLAMFCMIAALAGGWLVYYIDISSASTEAPRYYLYKVMHAESVNMAPLSDPETGYGRITVKGKITGTDAMSASLNNYFRIDGKYWPDFAGKFVEATGYLVQSDEEVSGQNPFSFDIQSIAAAPENEIDDTGKACASSLDCRNQCIEKKCSAAGTGK